MRNQKARKFNNSQKNLLDTKFAYLQDCHISIEFFSVTRRKLEP